MKSFALLLLLLASNSLLAQFEKGQKIALLQLSGYYAKDHSTSNEFTGIGSDQTYFRARATPGFGVFLSEHFVLGIGVVAEYREQIQTYINPGVESSRNQIESQFGGMLFTRKYSKLTEKINFFISGTASFVRGNKETDVSDIVGGSPYTTTSLTNSISFAATPGLMAFLTNRTALEASIGSLSYNHSVEYGPDSKTVRNGADLELGYFQLGIAVYL